MERADAVIVGGGIAGLSAAVTLCSKSDLNVILVEQRGIGSNRTIRAVFAETIDEFGLKDSVLREYTGFIFHSPSEAMASFDYQQVALAGLDYWKACSILYERAANHGLRLFRGKALGWSPEVPNPNCPLLVHLSDGTQIQTEVLIDASGPSQWAARKLLVQLSPYYSLCYGELLEGCSFPLDSFFRFLAPNSRYGNGGGWFYPTGQGSASIGYSIVVPRDQNNRTRMVAGYWAAKSEFRPYADWVKTGVRQHIEGGIIPIGRIGRFVADRILIVGDAAGQAYPWSVEGCRPGLENGRLCAQVVLHAFGRQRFDSSTLSMYEREWSKSNRERFWRTASAAEVVWTRSDKDWDRCIAAMRRIPPEQHLRALRDNRGSLFEQAYAVAGYARRRFMKWLRRRRDLCRP